MEGIRSPSTSVLNELVQAEPPRQSTALSKLLASRLAVALAQSMSLSEKLYEQFLDKDLPTAKSVDSLQDYADDLPESSWVTARSGNSRDYEPGEISN